MEKVVLLKSQGDCCLACSKSGEYFPIHQDQFDPFIWYADEEAAAAYSAVIPCDDFAGVVI